MTIFDILKKTVFRDASWNYTYQHWNFVYDPIALGALVVVLAVIVLTVPRWMDLSPRQFAVGLFLTSVLVFALGLFALPLELTRALDLDKRGLFNGAVYLVERGPVDFLSSFNTLPQTAPENEDLYIWPFDITQDDAAANAFAEWMGGLEWVPFNEVFAEYVGEYTTQKHGPVSVLFIAPFVLLFGKSTAAALVGGVVIACLIPVVGYYTFRLYFEEGLSRLGAVMVAIAPGLFIWTRHASPVPYDIVTALLVACTLYAFLKGIKTGRRRYLVATGIFLSLAAMTKLTGLLVLLPMAIILIREAGGLKEYVRQSGIIAGSWFAFPLTFLAAGYNFAAQLLYTAYKTTLYNMQSGGGGRPEGSPADALNNDLVGLVGTLYNGRWMNPVLLVLVAAFVGYLLYSRGNVKKDHHFVSAALLTAFLPFGVWVLFASGTFSRHTIVLVIPLAFIALSGLSTVLDNPGRIPDTRLEIFYRLAVIVAGLQLLINI
ncbi:phospholipid carrier-dependent glycosyltransferase [Halovenus sp. WSH3]|uniref:Phospholipid carrier-dependent glycosyltransferase n=1 Tax=Halovenus carboxidivorans TaxID=2692199 RepID=A0A6B0T7X1_9EURY|nr:glycosyltransferase family 39 protein [Halovenus carboxidivorans]MXR50990.1 phospholipid carrier-dependent glycosyltransferase [Halovenus carboxidivorans]